MNDRNMPQIHSAQRLITPDGTEAAIDTEIVPWYARYGHSVWQPSRPARISEKARRASAR
jgi:hypothetical protein